MGKVERSEAGRLLAELRRKYTCVCGMCGKTFKGVNTAVYCSNACRQKAKRLRWK